MDESQEYGQDTAPQGQAGAEAAAGHVDEHLEGTAQGATTDADEKLEIRAEPDPAAGPERVDQKARRVDRPSVAGSLMAQWAGDSDPDAALSILVLSIPEDPRGRPWVE